VPFDLVAACAPAGTVYLGGAKATPGSAKLTVDANGVVTAWTKHPTSISFAYATPFGSCGGFPPPNASSHCLELKWNGSTLDSDQSQNGGADFGVQGIKLIR
jgi:hypothetical protein